MGSVKVPETPSKTINEMLQARCGKPFDHPIKQLISDGILGIFTAINLLYSKINPDTSTPSHSKWMISCGVVSFLLVLGCYIGYTIVISSAFIVHGLLYYVAILISIFAIGIGASGMVFFDKNGSSKVEKPE